MAKAKLSRHFQLNSDWHKPLTVTYTVFTLSSACDQGADDCLCVSVRYTVPSVVSSLNEARLNRHTHQFNQYISMRSLNYFHGSLTSVFMSCFSLSFTQVVV